MQAQIPDPSFKSPTVVGETLKSGGAHYRNLKIQPIEFIEANGLGWHEGNVVKYISRWREKGGRTDLEKVIWYVQRLMEINELR